jgi:hypothetical protein
VEVQESPRSSLEYGTKLVTPAKGRWSFVLYPAAAEGGHDGFIVSIWIDEYGAALTQVSLLGLLPNGNPRVAANLALHHAQDVAGRAPLGQPGRRVWVSITTNGSSRAM